MGVVNKHYLYRHIRLDKNEPFYIGVGTKQHNDTFKNEYARAYTKNRNSSIWKRIIAKTDYKVEIIYESNDYQECLNKEIEFIKLYGRINLKTGTLANLTDGGEGEINKVISEETKRKMSIAQLNRKDIRIFPEKSKLILKEKALKRLQLGGLHKNSVKTLFKKGHNGTRNLIILNLENGIYYDSIKDAANSLNLDRRYLNYHVNNKINKTKFIKV